MSNNLPFADVLEAADHLSLDEQQELIAILNHRLAEAGRQRLATDIADARKEYVTGGCQPRTPADLLGEILE
jgi:hypothetical protein